jgi:histidinol phosphatase-like enzyme
MEVFLAADLKGDPARIRNPAMILGQTLCQEFIMDRAREWYVHDSAGVHMADFRTSQAEFSTAKTMRVSCDVRPSRYLCFELLPVRHVNAILNLLFG